jgi:hypothetical protein
MQRLEVSGAVRHIYIYIIRRLKVKLYPSTRHYPTLTSFSSHKSYCLFTSTLEGQICCLMIFLHVAYNIKMQMNTPACSFYHVAVCSTFIVITSGHR